MSEEMTMVKAVDETNGKGLATRSGADMLADRDTFDQMWRAAKLFAGTEMVPKHFRGKPQDCFVALNMARRLGEDPLIVMQNFYTVHGTPGWKTEYVIARAQRAGVFRGPIRWETKGSGKDLSVTAWARLADDGERVEVTCDMAMAVADGWAKNDKYKTMPEHMLRWRSAAFLVRLYAPQVMLGFQTIDEVEDLRVIEVSASGESVAARAPRNALDAFAEDRAEGAEESPQEPASGAQEAEEGKNPEGAKLLKGAIADLRKYAGSMSVSIDEVEAILGEKLEAARFPEAKDPAAAESICRGIIADLAESA